MHRVTRALALSLLLVSLASAETKAKKFWKWSIAALVAGATMDVATSYGELEGNSLLRGKDGRLGAKGAALKFGFIGGALLGEALIVRRHPEAALALGVANFGVGELLGGLAIRNRKTVQAGPQ